MTSDKNEDRLSHALEWCKEREIKNRLDLFSKKRKKKSVKGESLGGDLLLLKKSKED